MPSHRVDEVSMTNRRGFLSSIFAAAAAPAIVSASSLMKLVPTESGILTYELNPESLEKMMINIRNDIELRPTKLLVPAWLVGEALTLLNAEFDKAYAQYREQP